MLLFTRIPERFSVEAEVDYNSGSSYEEEEILSPVKNIFSKSLTDKAIVLDMDLTLLCTIGDGSDISEKLRANHKIAYNILVERGIVVPTVLRHFGKTMQNDIVRRPGVEEFLTFCRVIFKYVILWSAGQSAYVHDSVRLVLDPENKGLFDFVYTSPDVVQYSLDSQEVENMTDQDEDVAEFVEKLRNTGYSKFTAKPLEKLRDRFPDLTLENTVIVDDLPCNFLPNPKNGILIPPFSPHLPQILENSRGGQLDNMCHDHALFSLIHFFSDDAFLNVDDVRDYNLNFFRRF